MAKFYVFLLIGLFACNQAETDLSSFITVFEESKGLESAPYHQGITWWQDLANASSQITISEFGETDAGFPLHLVVLSSEGYSISDLNDISKSKLLINNAIHPGEPDGVDASMMLFRDLAQNDSLLDSCVYICIPYYNIGGALNRNSHSRANQNGPKEYGFRGNAQNLDLNRDFIKCDSKNAESFAKLLQLINPDLYIETHVSNGADYQYTMTYLSTQSSKLGGPMGKFLADSLNFEFEKRMAAKTDTIVPYVNVYGTALGNSYNAFYDSPRFSTGLTSLHGIYGIITETHMLKPFKNRVESTYRFLLSAAEICNSKTYQIKKTRKLQQEIYAKSKEIPLDWEKDTTTWNQFPFKGYASAYKPSDVSGEMRLYYDRNKPTRTTMKYYYAMKPTIMRYKPKAYILHKGYADVVNRLKWNGVEMEELGNNSSFRVVSYSITDYETVPNPYEKHYLHLNPVFSKDSFTRHFLKGDYLIKMGTSKDRFIMEVLEPDAKDSYFNWNFFDANLQQKEHYSSYVFEDKAAEYLKNDQELKAEFEAKKNSNPKFAIDGRAQLHWIYLNSKHYEKEHMRLPVYRVY